MSRQTNPEIRKFIFDHVGSSEASLATLVTQKFQVSRETAGSYLTRLVEEGILEASGQTRAKKYAFRMLAGIVETIPISAGLEEDALWRNKVSPLLGDAPENVKRICTYGFTEIVNNAIEHSGGNSFELAFARDYKKITMGIHDNGIGIFEKIKRDFHLEDRRQAILELSKGKLTSAPDRHSGEGIFFASRMFSDFSIASLDLALIKERSSGEDFLIEIESPAKEIPGTRVIMQLPMDIAYTTDQVFSKYTDDEYRFSKTNIPLKLAKYEGEQLVSRSQARRIMTRADRFSEIILDFEGITTIGQAFADEIFRVYAAEHPQVHIYPVKVREEVNRMIQHALANAAERVSSSSIASVVEPSESSGTSGAVALPNKKPLSSE